MLPVLPEVQVVHRALLVSHINVKGEEVDGRQCAAAKDFEESGQTVSLLHIKKGIWRGHFGRLVDNSLVRFPTPDVQKFEEGPQKGVENVLDLIAE